MSRLPISARLALLTSTAFLLLLAVLGAVLYHQLGESLRERVDQQLVDLAATLPPELTQQDADAGSPDGSEGDATERLLQVVGSEGALLVSSAELEATAPLLGAEALARVRAGEVLLTTVTPPDEDDPLRVLATQHGVDGNVALLALELDEVDEAQQVLLGLYGPAAVLGSVLAGLAGYVIARRGLAPISRMTSEAESIGGTDLAGRLSSPDRLDEVGRLARTLNGMLARLEAAVTREREFAADASHELRTPLAILRAELELALQETTSAAIRDGLTSSLEEVERLTALVDDLLVLARADVDRRDEQRPVDLGEVMAGVVSRFAAVAEQRHVTLRCTGEAVVRGDARGLDRAVANLIDNALRHTPAQGTIEVEIAAEHSGGARITVCDNGPGVPAEQLAHLFDRFTRVDSARNRPGGAGLGLAIVAAVAASHGGTATAHNRPSGGLCVTLDLVGGPSPVR